VRAGVAVRLDGILVAALAGVAGCTGDDTAVGVVDASPADATADGGARDGGAAAGDTGSAEDAAQRDPATACTATGGVVTTAPCCFQVGDFPDTCAAGACTCAPQYSTTTKVCDCPSGTCFGAKVPGCVTWDGGPSPP
jgi:hypothetical protein